MDHIYTVFKYIITKWLFKILSFRKINFLDVSLLLREVHVLFMQAPFSQKGHSILFIK